MELRNELTLTVPFDGIVAEMTPDLYPGVVVAKGEWLGDIIQPNTAKIEAYAPQIEINRLGLGLQGYFYPQDLSESAIPVKITSIDAINTAQLNCHYSTEVIQEKKKNAVVDTPCYNANELGGEIPTYATDEGNYVPVSSLYRILLIPEKPIKLSHIQRGTVILTTQPRSYAYRFFYTAKTIWIEELGF